MFSIDPTTTQRTKLQGRSVERPYLVIVVVIGIEQDAPTPISRSSPPEGGLINAYNNFQSLLRVMASGPSEEGASRVVIIGIGIGIGIVLVIVIVVVVIVVIGIEQVAPTPISPSSPPKGGVINAYNNFQSLLRGTASGPSEEGASRVVITGIGIVLVIVIVVVVIVVIGIEQDVPTPISRSSPPKGG